MASGPKVRAGISQRNQRNGPATAGAAPRTEPLVFWSLVAFAALAVLWFAFRALPEPDPRWFRALSRLSAYGAAVFMLVPYIHILRRGFRYRYWGKMSTWLRWHILAAYLGFGLAIIHSRARSNNELTLAIQVALWAVIVSGVVGYCGQKLIYRLLALMVDDELGLERLPPEREARIQEARDLIAGVPVISADDVVDWQRLRDRLAALAESLKKQLEPAPADGGAERPAKQTDEADSRRPLREAFQSVNRIVAPQAAKPTAKALALVKKPDPEKENADLIGAINRLVKAEGLFDLAKRDELTPPVWLAPIFAKPPATRIASENVVLNHWVLAELMRADALAPTAARTEAVTAFCERVLSESLCPKLATWGWLFSGRALAPIPQNHYLRVHELCGATQRDTLEAMWKLVENRRQMDLEAWLHRVGRAWLLVHGPASWALLVLVAIHVWLSVRYGGY
jgi:hypothetical protein